MAEKKAPEELTVVQIPEILPLLPVSGAFIFPKMLFPLEVSGTSPITLIDETMAGDRLLGLVMLVVCGFMLAWEVGQAPVSGSPVG